MSWRYITEKFVAVDDQGEEYTITKTRTFETIKYLDGHTEEFEKLPSLTVPMLGHVNKLSDTEFQIVATGTKLLLKGSAR